MTDFCKFTEEHRMAIDFVKKDNEIMESFSSKNIEIGEEILSGTACEVLSKGYYSNQFPDIKLKRKTKAEINKFMVKQKKRNKRIFGL